MISTMQMKWVRNASALAVATGACAIVAPLAGADIPDLLQPPAARALVFYAITAGAYALLPWRRRSDIVLVAMWLVLAVGVAPCFGGREISAVSIFADMAGVGLAALPVYIARFRQLMQDDFRLSRRRSTDQSMSGEVGPGAPARQAQSQNT